jgi:lysophospholipase L1-like esterase
LKAAFKNVIRHRSLANGETRAIAVGQPVDLFYFFVLLFACMGLVITSSIVNLTKAIHPSFKPAITLALPQPGHFGSVTINRIAETPATIVMAGDSLARGKGSRTTNGKLENIGYYLVQKANSVEPGVANYQVLTGLSVDGSPVEDMNKRLKTQSGTLAHIPNLVLVMSFTNGDLVHFVTDAKNAQSSNRIIAFFKVLGILHKDSVDYQRSLITLRSILADLHTKRVKVLGAKKAAMQAVILGVPNEAYSPPIKATLHKYQLTYDELDYVINTFNTDDQKAAILGNNDKSGVAYSFVNLDKIQISEKTALTYLSSDQFHPNYRGYQSLADFVGQNVRVQEKNQSVYLANK